MKKLEPEDINFTEYDSGYIDREGRFYGCAFSDHIDISKELCEKYKLKVKSQGRRDWVCCEDYLRTLDELGFVKISDKRFYWDHRTKPNEAQIKAIVNFMMNKKMRKAHFNRVFLTEDKKKIADVFPEFQPDF